MVDRFDGSFWGQRDAMNYAYGQRNFGSFAEMLDWCAANNVDWGWKEGSNYGQLFYSTGPGGTTPAFAETISAKGPSDCSLEGNDPGAGARYRAGAAGTFGASRVECDTRAERLAESRDSSQVQLREEKRPRHAPVLGRDVGARRVDAGDGAVLRSEKKPRARTAGAARSRTAVHRGAARLA